MNDKPSVVILRFLRGNAGVQNLRHAQPGTVDFFVVDGMAEEPIQIRQGREFFILPILFKDLRTRRLIQIHQRVQDHFEFILVFIIGNDPVVGIPQQIQPIKGGLLRHDRPDIDTKAQQEIIRFIHCTIEQDNQLVDILRWELRAVITGRVLRQRSLHVLEHIDIVHDDAAGLTGIHAVGAGDGLHQCVSLHRLVQIECGQVFHIKTRQPHGTDKHKL